MRSIMLPLSRQVGSRYPHRNLMGRSNADSLILNLTKGLKIEALDAFFFSIVISRGIWRLMIVVHKKRAKGS